MLPGRNKSFGHHTDYGVGVPTEQKRFANGVRIAAQITLSERIADHRDARSTPHVFGRRNHPAQHWRNTKDFEEP
jgi:hypothetical protein